MNRILTVTAAVAATAAAFAAAPASAQAAALVTVKTPLIVSAHGQRTATVRPTYTVSAGARATRASVTVFAGKRKVAAGPTVALKPGQYSEVTSVVVQRQVVTHPLRAVVTPTQVPVVTPVTVPGQYESLFVTATCTVTSWSVTSGTNFNDGSAYQDGMSTANCVNASFPGVVEQDFALWGYNDHDDIFPPVAAGFIGTAGATYTANVLFSGPGPATVVNTTTYVTQDVTTYVPSTVISWSAPFAVTARRVLTVTK